MLFPRKGSAAGRSKRDWRARVRRRAGAPRLGPEELESRQLLSNVSWTGGGNDDLWSDPKNWSDDQVPGAADDVTISLPGSFTISYDATAGDTTIDSLSGSDALSIIGGSLTIAATSASSPASTLTGPLSIGGGSLIASGADTTATASGPVTATTGELAAQAGATFRLPGLTAVDANGLTLSAVGTGTTLDISAVTGFGGTGTTIAEIDGAELSMHAGFTSLNGVLFTIDATSDLPAKVIGNLTSLTDGGLDVLGGTYAFPNLANINDSSLSVSGGASLTLAGVTTVNDTVNGNAAFLATDTTSGGTLDLPSLTTIGPDDGLQVEAIGSKSEIELPELTSFTALDSFAFLFAIDSATVYEPMLTSLDGVIVLLDGTGVMPIKQWTTLKDSSLSVGPGNYSPTPNAATADNSFAHLSDIDRTSLYVSGGSLTLPDVTKFHMQDWPNTFEAFGTGAVLNLPALTSISRSTYGGGSSTSSGYYAQGRLNLQAMYGGKVLAPSLASVTTGYEATAVGVQAQGNGSLVELTGLSTFVTFGGLMSATQGGVIELSSTLTTLDSVRIFVDGTGGIITPTDPTSLDAFTTWNYDAITVEAGTYDLPNLTSIDNDSVDVYGGGSLTIPNVTSYTNDVYPSGTYISVDDTYNGGTLSLPGLTTIDSEYVVNIAVAGSASALDLPALASWTTYEYYYGPSTLSVTQGGTVADGNLTSLSGVDVTLDGTGKMAVSQWASFTGGQLSITGGNYSPTSKAATSDNAFTGLADIDGSGLYVTGGGSLTLPAVTSYSLDDRNDGFTASGAGAVLDLPALRSVGGGIGAAVIGTSSYSEAINFRAYGGGHVLAPVLTSIDPGYEVPAGAQARGAGSLVDLPSLTTYDTYDGQLSATQGGTVVLGAGLTSLYGADITVDGTAGGIITPTDSTSLGNFTAVTYGSITILGGTYTLGLTSIDGSSLAVSGGGSLTLPDVTTYSSDQDTSFQATDTTDGGTISLPALNSISTDDPLQVDAAGAHSVIDLAALTSWTDDAYYNGDQSDLSVTQGATVDDGGLTSLTGVMVTLDGTGKLAIGQWKSLTNGGLNIIDGADYPPATGANSNNSFTSLTDIDGSSLYVSGGGSLTLTGITSYTNDDIIGAEFGATDVISGGRLNLPNLASISGYWGLEIRAAGAASQIDLPALTSLVDTDADYGDRSPLSVIDGATVEDGALTTLTGINVQLDGTGKLATKQWTALVDGGLSIVGGKYTSPNNGNSSGSFAALTDINGSGLYVSGGGSLTLPGVQAYDPVGQDVSFDASGTASGRASALSLPKLATITTTSYDGYLRIDATAGGQVGLPALASIDTVGDDTPVTATANGHGSLVNMPDLGTFEVDYGGQLSATSGGSIAVNAGLKSLVGVTVVVDGTGTLAVGQFTSITDGGITVEGGNYLTAFPALTDIDGSNLTVYGGGELDLPGVTTYTNDFEYTTFEAYEYYYDSVAGLIDLPALTTIGGDYGASIEVAGSGSTIEMPVLTAIDPIDSNVATLSVVDQGTVQAGDLTTLNGVSVTLDGTGTLATGQWTSLTDGSLTITAGDYSSASLFAGLSDINGSSVYVYGGGKLTLPAVTSYDDSGGDEFLQAAEYSEYSYGYSQDESYYFGAGTVGTLDLPALTTITGDYLYVVAGGSGSAIDLPSLTSFVVEGGGLTVTAGATVADGSLTTMGGVVVALDGTGTLSTAGWTSLTGGGLVITAGDYSGDGSSVSAFTGLADIDGTDVYVYGGGKLTLPAVVTYSGGTATTYLDADEYLEYNGSTGLYYGAGTVGVLSLPSLTGISGEYVYILTGGSGSEILVPDLTRLIFGYDGYVAATSQGDFYAPSLGAVVNGTISTDPTASVTVVAGQTLSFPGGSSTVETGTLVDQGGVVLGGSEPFTLSTYTGGGTGIIQTATASTTSPSTFDIPVSIADPTEVYTLINSAYGEYGDTVGAVEFKASGGLTYTVDLVEGQDIRDHNNDGDNNVIGLGALGPIYLGTASYGGGQVRLDEQGFVLPSAFQSATLTDIILIGYGNVPDGQPFLAAATVATSGGPVAVGLGSLVNANLQTYSNGGDYPVGGSTITANSTVHVIGGLTINGQGTLSVSSGSTLEISGSLLGNTTNVAGFSVAGTVDFDGAGTSTSPQLLEAMSDDLGASAAGFQQGTAFGTLELGAYTGTYVKMVNQSNNSGGSADAVYADTLIVPSGTTLNLNGLHLYVRTPDISGTVTGGSITVVASTDDWISTSSGDWDVASNWSNGVPTASENAVIDVPGITVTVDSTDVAFGLTADDPISITGGSLTLGGNSTIGGGLSMTGGSLVADGSGITVTVSGTTTIAGGSLYAEGGATLTLSSLTSYTEPNGFSSSTLEATGAGSVLSLPALTSIAETAGYTTTYLEAASGGDVEVPAVTQITGAVEIEVGAGDTIDLAGLTTFTSGVLVYSGGTLNAAGTTAQLPSLTDAADSTIEVSSGASLAIPTLTDADGGSLEVGAGGSLTLADLASYTEANGFASSTLEATGTGSLLSLPKLTSIAETAGYTTTYVEALSGGDVEVPAVTQITGSVAVESEGTGSKINLSVLATFTGGSLTVTQSGTALDPDLKAFSAAVTLDGTGTLATSQWTSLTNGSLTITGGTYSFGLTDADGSSLVADAGASLTLPLLATYTEANGFSSSTLEATGASSLLSLPKLTSIAETAGYTTTYVEALSGGDVEVPAVTQITGSVAVESEGTGSKINLSVLATFTGGSLTVTQSGTALDPDLKAFSAAVTLDGTGTLATSQWTSLTSGSITITGGTYSFGLTDADGSSLVADAGASLTLPLLTTYTEANGFSSSTLEATGASSLLSLPKLTSIAETAGYTTTYVEALSGGDVELPLVTQLTGSVAVESEGTGSKVNLSAVTALSGGSLTITTGGSVTDPALGTLTNETITIGSTDTFTLPAGQTFTFPSGTSTFNGGTFLDDGNISVQGTTTLDVKGGLTINGQGALSVASGATLDVTGSLLGNTTDAAGFSLPGTVDFNGSGTSSSPQQLEVMSSDLGDTTAGFNQNFTYSTLELANNTYVELVDQSNNSGSGSAEALYVNDLIVPAGTTLNLNGLHLYIHSGTILGTIIGGGAFVTGEVYDDANDNGNLDSGESGLAGWTVTLTNTSTLSTYTTTTDSNGQYGFAGIAAGSYTLSETLQSGFAETQPAAPGTYSLTLSVGQVVSGEDFGNHATAVIGGEVYNDLNGNGVLNGGEPGLSGWTVDLLNSSNTQIATATTGSGGTYSFSGLLPGTYTVEVVEKTGYVASSSSSVQVTDTNGQSDTVNFGQFAPVTVAGEVFLDNNGDGKVDGSDTGLSGWTVELVQGNTIVQTTSGTGGAYSFSSVGPGTWTLEVVQQAGYASTDSPVSITPTSGTNLTGENLGEFQTVTIGGEVYDDLSDSGTLKPGDPGLVGWTVDLLKGTTTVATTTTDANGNYTFTDVGAGTYTIEDVLQPGFVQTQPASASYTFTTASGVNVSGENFGAVQGASLAVTGLSVTPTPLQSGTGLVVSWDDTNGGNLPITASFTDHVVITNVTTGQVLGVADVPYNVTTRGRLNVGASAAQQYAFTLPNGNPGVGNIQFTVTADDYDAVSGGLTAANRTSTVTLASSLAPYADVAPSAISAPATATAGQKVTVSWTDSNLGNAATPGPWIDEILLSYDGTIADAVPVGTLAISTPIAAGSSSPEQAQVTIPVLGAASGGSLQFVIEANVDASFFELNTSNNAAIDATPTTVPLALTLTSTVSSIAENAANPTILGTITRSGPTTQALTVNLSSSNTSQFSVPATVTIPAGQSFAPVTFTVLDDGIVDPNQLDTITATASGYQNGTVGITDINTDTASLSVSFPSGSTVAKGSYLSATVSRTGSDAQAVTVSLGTNSPAKIYVPGTVTIPAGSTSATFNVQAVNDDEIEGTQTYAFTAAATGLIEAIGDVTVTDSDVPTLSLSLAAATVNESAGPLATTATLTASFVSDVPIVVDITAPSGSPVTLPTSVTIPANTSTVTFAIGTFVNGSTQSIQATQITAEVTTITNGTPLTQGSATATLDVVNASAPQLQVSFAKPAVVQNEPSATTGTVTIVNGTAPTSPLTVTLTSTDSASATVPTTVTIEAGQLSATFPISTPADTQNLGVVQPEISASASGYGAGEAKIIVTDVPEPVNVVSNITVPDPGNDQLFTITYMVTNEGTATAVGPWEDALYITDQPTGGTLTPLTIDQPGTPTNEIAFNGTLPPGESYSRSVSVFAPEATGQYWVVVQTDSDLTLGGATTSNGTSVATQPLAVVPSYTATVQADQTVNLANSPVPISGTATLEGGGPAAYQVVNIDIFSQGTVQTISAVTNANGLFAAEWQPLPGEAGNFSIGAANPGVPTDQVASQGTFEIVGMSAQPTGASVSVIADGAAAGGQATINNLSTIPLTDLTTSVQGLPSNLHVNVTLGNGSTGQGLPGSGSLGLTYSVTATGSSAASGTFTIAVTSNEGATVDIPVSFIVIADVPDVVASPTSLQAGMIVGSQTLFEFTLDNTGGADSGPLSIVLPSQASGSAFLSLATSGSIASIPAGGSTTVTLLLTPPSGLPLGTYSGSIQVVGASGTTTIPFKFFNLSSATGELDITTVDEYTFFAPGAPDLAGASVTVVNAETDQVAATGTTNASGQLDLPNLPIGTYEITATASGNSPYDGTAVVSVGQVTQVTAFLPLQLVTTTFTVTPTSVQDDIQVQINTTFESNVPAPVITASPQAFDVGSLTAVGDTIQYNLTIANHGLVSAVNMQLYFASDPDYTVTPLITDIGTLPGESSLTIPIIIERTSLGLDGPCSIPGYLSWDINVVGPNTNVVAGFLGQQIPYSESLVVYNVQGDCPPGAGGEGGGLLGGFYGGEGGSINFSPIITSEPSDCNGCQTATDAALLQYNEFPDWESAGTGLGSSLASGATDVIADATGFLSALVAYLQATPDIGEAVSLIDTAEAAVAACESSDVDATSSVIADRQALQAFAQGFRSLVNETNDIFGGTDFINPYSGPDLTKWLEAFVADAAGGQPITSGEASSLESLVLPEEVTLTDVENFIARWNQTIADNSQGIYDTTQVPNGGSTNFIARNTWMVDLQTTDVAYAQVTTMGSTSFSGAILFEMQQLLTDTSINTPLGGICTQVQLQLDQNVVVTRSAFNATLDIQNDKTDPITDIGVTITIRDAQGNDVTDLFDIGTPTLSGLTAVDGTGTLAASASGSAIFTLIPTNGAAPTAATMYYVSGQLTYQVDGMNLAIPFSPETITVQPSPSLTLRYFEQSAVYSQNPDDSQSEGSEPFVLGVQVVNTGAGTASNVSITSAQPEIVNSLSGLLASFQLVATQVDGQNLTPSLTVNLGSIAPGGIATALFLMTSSVDGQFVSYNATFEDESGLGSSQLSIINGVSIYNLIHLASEIGPNASTGTGFLVSDIPGAASPPDAVFLPDGSVAPVAQAQDVQTSGTLGDGDLTMTLTDSPTSGWNYLNILDPGDGNYTLVSVERSDGVYLPANDFWQTDQTYVSDGQPPIAENDLHILDDGGTGTYTLTYVPSSVIQPEITSIQTVSPDPIQSPVSSIQVTFNEPIAIGTLDPNVLDLSLDGGANLIGSNSGITVSLVSGSTYQINGLSALDGADGTYTLTVNAAGVEDPFGDAGAGTASTVWEMAATKPAVSTIAGVEPGERNTPVGSVTVTFTEPIDASSFGLSALSLTEDGGSNLITAGSDVTITQLGPSSFTVSGLSSLTTSDGDYVLTVSGAQVTANGVAGIGSDSVAWTMDTVAPLVSSFSSVSTPRNTPADDIDVTFSKPIDPSTFTDAALSLTLNGGSNLITSGVTVSLVSGSTYEIAGLSGLEGSNGTYQLTVNGDDVSDLAGNVGTNSLSVSWLLETTIPAAPSDLAITPNTGGTPGVTDTGSLTLTGTLPETGMTVDVFDESTNTNLGPAAVSGTSFSMPLNLLAGTTNLSITATDDAGNVSPAALFTIFVDESAPTVSSFAAVTPNPTNTAVGTVDVTFSKPINAATFTAADLSLTDDGGPNLINGSVTITPISGTTTFAIGGLAGLTTAEGTYTLTVNATGIQDTSGNVGFGSLSTTWLMDVTPPTSSVSSLPATVSGTSVLVTVTGNDPAASDGGAASGLASFAIYVSEDGGPFSLFTTVTPTNPSAIFTGQAGHTYGFYSVATDKAGNVQPTPTGAQATTQFASSSSLTISSVAAVSPNPRDTSVTSIDLTFNEAVQTGSLASGAVTLTDDGQPVAVSGLAISLVSGTTYAINGLSAATAAQGLYTLTINAADILDSDGVAGTGTVQTSWLMDATAPTAAISVPTSVTSLTFPVTITGVIPTLPAGSPTVDVTSFAVYVSVNGGPWSFFENVSPPSGTPDTVSFNFTGESSTVYSFYTAATDNAGNTASYSPTVQASINLPALNTPVTQVAATSVYNNDGTFTLNLSGTDAGGNGLVYFEVYVALNAGTPQLIGPAIPAGVANAGTYTASTTFVMPAADYGASNTYKFYSVGIDASGLVEPMHSLADDTFSEAYSEPATSALAIDSVTVENGAAERSYIRYLDLNFNDATPSVLQAIATAVNGGSNELTLTHYDITGTTNLGTVSLQGLLSVVDNAIEVDFGAAGIGGNASTTTADGYYVLNFSPAAGGGKASTSLFDRLLGDVNGDGTVSQLDLTDIAAAMNQSVSRIAAATGQPPSILTPMGTDVNGDGTVNATDVLLATKSKGRTLGTPPSLGS